MKAKKLTIFGRRITFSVVLLSALAFLAVSCEKEESFMMADARSTGTSMYDAELKTSSRAPAPGDASIAAIAIDAGFSELVGALAYVDAELNAGLVDLFLNGTDQFTVFAPTNDAFEGLYGALGINEITDLPAELVLDVLFYHVAEGRRAANSVVPRAGRPRAITTLLGETFSVSSNGVITDIAGQNVNIVAADISASNGIIHVVDAVLLPISDNASKSAMRGGRSQAVPAAPAAPAPGEASIAAIAIDAGFSELVGALVYVDAELNAGLVDLFLNGTDQFTVFAPTNEAFEGLYGALGINGITDLPAELVLDVLFYHVAEGRRAANSVVPRARTRAITTLLGETFSVSSTGVITDIAGQNVNIVAADISASNGIIHVIDTVLLPLQ